jgi:hypothetical protein
LLTSEEILDIAYDKGLWLEAVIFDSSPVIIAFIDARFKRHQQMGSGHSTYCCSYETYLMRVALNISHTTLLVHGVVEKVYQMGARSRQEWSQRPEAMKQ